MEESTDYGMYVLRNVSCYAIPCVSGGPIFYEAYLCIVGCMLWEKLSILEQVCVSVQFGVL